MVPEVVREVSRGLPGMVLSVGVKRMTPGVGEPGARPGGPLLSIGAMRGGVEWVVPGVVQT